MPTLRIVVQGRVQGVGFRNFTQQTARAMGLTGEVWNRSDGGVEMVAEHSDERVLEAFADAIEAGPGHVRDVQRESTATRGYDRFEVGNTR